MRVAVVGGSGFLGRAVVRDLLAHAHAVVNVDRAPPRAPLPGEELVTIDLLEPGSPERVAAAVGGADGVVWTAAIIRHRLGVDATAPVDLALMVEAPLYLLRALQPAPRAFVNVSSIQVYGAPVRLPIDEDHPTDPFTAYGVAKLHAEHMLAIAGRAHGVAVASLRVAFIYGPGQHPANALPRFLEAVRRGEPPTVHGAGNDLRDDVYVGDVARAIRLALEQRADGAFNVSSGRPHTILDVARAACALGPAGMAPRHDEAPSDWVDRWYSIERAREAFGYAPETSFADGVRAMWDAEAAS